MTKDVSLAIIAIAVMIEFLMTFPAYARGPNIKPSIKKRCKACHKAHETHK